MLTIDIQGHFYSYRVVNFSFSRLPPPLLQIFDNFTHFIRRNKFDSVYKSRDEGKRATTSRLFTMDAHYSEFQRTDSFPRYDPESRITRTVGYNEILVTPVIPRSRYSDTAHVLHT